MKKLCFTELVLNLFRLFGINKLCHRKQFEFSDKTYKVSIYEIDFRYYCILFDDNDNHLYEDIIKNVVGMYDECVIMSFKEIIRRLMTNYIKVPKSKNDRIIWDD